MTGKNFETERERLLGPNNKLRNEVWDIFIEVIYHEIKTKRHSRETLLRNGPISWKTTQIVVIFLLSTNWSKLFVLTGTSFVWRSFFLARQTRGGGEQFARVTRDYSSNNFGQLGVRRCKNAPCRVSSDKWPGVGTGSKYSYRGYLNCFQSQTGWRFYALSCQEIYFLSNFNFYIAKTPC